MVTWGIAAAAAAVVVGPRSFYVTRFVLGLAEAGFFPGVAYYLAVWFPDERGTAAARNSVDAAIKH
jgi:MFS family permease